MELQWIPRIRSVGRVEQKGENRIKSKETIILLLCIWILAYLSGCTTKSFDFKSYYFYNPITNEKGSIHLQKLNTTDSSNIIRHNDQFVLSVGIKDSMERLGKNISLSIHFTYNWEWYNYTVLFLNSSLNKFTTNASGIASITIIFNQYEWPIAFGKGMFRVISLLSNATAKSPEVQFNYLSNEIYRGSDEDDGLEKILFTENLNLIELINQKYSVNNSYLNWREHTYELETAIINSTTINRLSSRVTTGSSSNYYLKFHYSAIALRFINTTVNYTFLQEHWDQHSLSHISIKNLDLVCASLEDPPLLNVTSGWIIMQTMSYYRRSGPLNADFIDTFQIAILDMNDDLIWLASEGWHGVS